MNRVGEKKVAWRKIARVGWFMISLVWVNNWLLLLIDFPNEGVFLAFSHWFPTGLGMKKSFPQVTRPNGD